MNLTPSERRIANSVRAHLGDTDWRGKGGAHPDLRAAMDAAGEACGVARARVWDIVRKVVRGR